jgi:hypothetical protein
LEENLFHYYIFLHKSHKELAGLESDPPQWQTGDKARGESRLPVWVER